MRRVTVSSLLLLAAACTTPADPVDEGDVPIAALVSSVPQVFVLGSAGGIAAEPIVTFDHTCQAIRYVHAVRDSIILNPDGTAIRSLVIERFADGRVLDLSPMVARGTWRRMTNTRNLYYYGDGPSIELTLSVENSRVPISYTMPLRVRENSLSNRSPMGGSCPGSPNDAREAEFIYTRR